MESSPERSAFLHPARVAVLGAGLMGAQIGAEYALAGSRVALVTQTSESSTRALARAEGALDALVAHGLAAHESVRAAKVNLSGTTDMMGSCTGADLIIESLPESLSEKTATLRRAVEVAPDAIVASNTSSIPIADIGTGVGAASRTIGTHYWNPPTLMPLVEVIPSKLTDPAVTARVVGWLRAMGKEPVTVRDVIGFVHNRLQFALIHEAVRLVNEGVTDAETIDRIVERGLARRWQLVGPFTTMMLGGRPTFAAIARLLFEELERPVDPNSILGLALEGSSRPIEDVIRRRDAGLASALRNDRRP
ncbi:MAG: 3-hydroxyacyl-CoA dehydrogenase family protein [Actinomycetota bacterium]|nr:3-hydroxyacyl-CoA dehydrogenase family protein [Actinomycetota bacterium]